MWQNIQSHDHFRHRFVKIQLVDYDYDHNCDYYSKSGIRTISQSQKKEKKEQRPATLFRNYKINTYIVRKILDNSFNVWMVYLLAC